MRPRGNVFECCIDENCLYSVYTIKLFFYRICLKIRNAFFKFISANSKLPPIGSYIYIISVMQLRPRVNPPSGSLRNSRQYTSGLAITTRISSAVSQSAHKQQQRMSILLFSYQNRSRTVWRISIIIRLQLRGYSGNGICVYTSLTRTRLDGALESSSVRQGILCSKMKKSLALILCCALILVSGEMKTQLFFPLAPLV